MRFALAGRLKRRTQKAYTITEVVVAMLVLSAMLVTLYAGFSEGFAFVQTGREDLRGTQLMLQKAEVLRVMNWSDLVSNCPITFHQRYDPLSPASSKGASYSGVVTADIPTNIPSTASYLTNMRLITISLTWTNYNGHTPTVHNREMQTLVAKYGVQNYIWGLH